MEPRELLLTAARAAAVYALMLFVIRIAGKRTIGNFTAFDLLVALMLGEVVDEIIFGDVTFAQGVTAIVAVAAMQYANSWMSYWDHGLDRVLEGSPSVVVRSGQLERDGSAAIAAARVGEPRRPDRRRARRATVNDRWGGPRGRGARDRPRAEG